MYLYVAWISIFFYYKYKDTISFFFYFNYHSYQNFKTSFSEITNKFKMLDYITSIINPAMDVATEQTLSDIAHRLRIHSIEATNASNSG